MRVQQAKQRVGQLGEFVIEPVMHARREKCRALKQARDVRVVHRVGGKAQPGGDLRVGIGKLGCQTLDRVQFPFVIREQVVRHQI